MPERFLLPIKENETVKLSTMKTKGLKLEAASVEYFGAFFYKKYCCRPFSDESQLTTYRFYFLNLFSPRSSVFCVTKLHTSSWGL